MAREQARQDKQASATSQPRLLVVNDSRDPLADDATVLNTVKNTVGVTADAVFNTDFLPSVDNIHYTSRLYEVEGNDALLVMADLIDEFCTKMAVFKNTERLAGQSRWVRGYAVPVSIATETGSRARMGVAQVWVSTGTAYCVIHAFNDNGDVEPVEASPEDTVVWLLNAMPDALRDAALEDGGKRYYKARFGTRKSA